MDAGIFYHVTRGERFSEGFSALFRFKQDEVGSILNMKQPSAGGAAPYVFALATKSAALRRATFAVDKSVH